MIETNPTLTRAQRQAQQQAERMRLAVRVLCQRRAQEEVKARIRREGRIKLSQVPPREIVAGTDRVFAENQSGIKTNRAALARCLRGLEAGDALLVTKLDRLARSTRDLLNTLATISDKGASFKSLGDPWPIRSTPHGRLMLTVLGGLAEFERHLILARTDEGRKGEIQRC